MKNIFGFDVGQKKSAVRKETRTVSTPQPSSGGLRKAVPSQKPSPRLSGSERLPTSAAPSPASPGLNGAPLKSRFLEVRRLQKRKSASPSLARLESDSEGDSDVPDVPAVKRRKGPHKHHVDRKGTLRARTFDRQEAQSLDGLIQAKSLTGRDVAGQYAPLLTGDDGRPLTLALQYPGSSFKESFEVVHPKSADEYKPLEDLTESVLHALTTFWPADSVAVHLDESRGFLSQIRRGVKKGDAEEVCRAVHEYNALIATGRADGSIAAHLDALERLPEELIKRVLDQVYARTVSPHVELLRQYQAASDNVYGELLPKFASMVFREAQLEPSSVFLDLGSGVGNVVLQAALEIGCEAHGLEVMANACTAARAQEKEFKARCLLWGLATGSVNLMEGDFLTDERLGPILRRADVVLVNNQAFQPELNARLKDLLLDLKEGARLVSLKTFVTEELNERNYNDVGAGLEVREEHYYDGYVSWKHEGGTYYIATKNSKGIERRLRESRKRRG